MQIVHNGWSML